MAQTTETVLSFLEELRVATKEYAEAEVAEIEAYAHTIGFEGKLMPWDMSYYSEKYKNEKYAVNDELVKPYLKLDNVIDAVFMLATKHLPSIRYGDLCRANNIEKEKTKCLNRNH